MNLKKGLEPKDTEEVRPGLYAQKKADGSWKQIEPLVWKGKWRLKNQISWRNLLTIVLIILLFFSGAKYVRFYEAVNQDPEAFCKNVQLFYNVGQLDVQNEDTYNIQSYPSEISRES
ncbi:hypothetical protein LCGC14_0465860 [marine sediment metagenome]|uniref:Uncharacterized protein n=1 Tax=marine sediment metagenome TaxID=412755 RepID=A0A0F9SWL4_9ZZZZ